MKLCGNRLCHIGPLFQIRSPIRTIRASNVSARRNPIQTAAAFLASPG